MRQLIGSAALLGVTLLMAGCSQSTLPEHELSQAPAAVPSDAAGIPPAAAGYTLTADEMKLDCPKLTGRMKVKIANMRSTVSGPATTQASRVLQGATAPIMGHSLRGADIAADLQRERAQLEAFNRRLAEKKCRTLDLDAELRGQPAAPTKGKA